MALTLPIFPIDPFLPVEREQLDPGVTTGYGSGIDQGRPRWSRPKMKWSLRIGALTTAERATLNGFLRTVRKTPFLFFDLQDCVVTGEQIGTGDGAVTVFYLDRQNIKDASYTFYSNGAALVEGTDYTLGQDNGLLTFMVAPAAGAAITGSYSWYWKTWNPGDSWKDTTNSATAHAAELTILEFWP